MNYKSQGTSCWSPPDYFLVLFRLVEFVNIQLGSGESPPHVGWVLHVGGVEGSRGQTVHHHLRLSDWVCVSEAEK